MKEPSNKRKNRTGRLLQEAVGVKTAISVEEWTGMRMAKTYL